MNTIKLTQEEEKRFDIFRAFKTNGQSARFDMEEFRYHFGMLSPKVIVSRKCKIITYLPGKQAIRVHPGGFTWKELFLCFIQHLGIRRYRATGRGRDFEKAYWEVYRWANHMFAEDIEFMMEQMEINRE